MDVIERIRCDNGAEDSILGRRAEADPSKGKLDSSLHILSEELYSKESHFILELVQNADDNIYALDVTPTLQMTLDNDKLFVACNEQGFNESQVRAICGIGASTKKHRQGSYIGFKSVFKVANKVYISSDPYKFMFDKTAELGMITPSWADDAPGRDGWTQFTLHLSDATNKFDIASRLFEVGPTLLLFLRQLRHLKIVVGNKSVDIRRFDRKAQDIIHLKVVRNSVESLHRYLTVKSSVKTPLEKKRSGISQSEIVLAFPLSIRGGPKIHPQDVHAFLPIRPYGFSFLIQGDFLTSANREDILSDSLWNIDLRTGIVSTFIKAVDIFQSRPEMAYVWHKYIPLDIPDDFFSDFRKSLIARLKRTEIFFSRDGRLYRPSQLIVPSEFIDDDGEPLVSEGYLNNLHYLSSDYDLSDTHRELLYKLGVIQLSSAAFIMGLANMSRNWTIGQQTVSWREAVSTHLLGLLGVHRREIMALRMIPLQDGSWVSFSNDLLFNSDVADIPQDLNLRLVAKLDPESSCFRLLTRLGVKNADVAIVSTEILAMHMHSNGRLSPALLLAHAHFIFAHRDAPRSPDPDSLKQLYLLAQDNTFVRASELYMDHGKSRITPLSDIISRTRFIHPSYCDAPRSSSRQVWQMWLQNVLGVNVSPRMIHGQFSPEFLRFLSSSFESLTGTEQALRALRDYWPQFQSGHIAPNAIQDLRNTIVTVQNRDGGSSQCKLSTTAVWRRPLRTFPHLPFLPINDPENGCWDFLGQLRVTLRPDSLLYLKWLQTLSQENSEDTGTIISIYQQLDARFDDDDSAHIIIQAFNQERLIFVKKVRQWLPKSDVIWNSPPSIRSKHSIKHLYPTLEKFFRTRLYIPDCPGDLLFREITQIASANRGSLISEEVHKHVSHLLEDISLMLKTRSRGKIEAPAWISRLPLFSIFPIRVAGKVKLRNLEEKFYIPDKSGKLYLMFRDVVDVLELADRDRVDSIGPLLEHELFRFRVEPHYMETAVLYQSSSAGERVPDIETQENYLMRAHLVNRMLYKEHSQVQAQSLSAKFRNLVSYKVESIVTTYTLDGTARSRSEDLIIEDEPKGFVVVISTTGNSSACDLQFHKRMAALLSLSKSVFSMVLVLPLATAALLLDEEGFSGQQLLGPISDSDDSWVQEVVDAGLETTKTGWKTARTRIAAPHQSAARIAPSESSVDMATLIQLNMQMVADAAAQAQSSVSSGQTSVSGITTFVPIGERNMIAAPIGHELDTNTAVAPLPSPTSFSSTEGFESEGGSSNSRLVPNFATRREVTPSEDVNGVLGEFYVSHFGFE
ncbi:hypothetical protein B0H10DRAFT_1978899 [Mycena sp. CBHHK59/15]|nr:hypothetical protein B0H10DRAFT_1978899 [Mycena sp. CBHHK59/15]